MVSYQKLYPYELIWNTLWFNENTELNFDLTDRFHSFQTWQQWKDYALKKQFNRMDFGDTSILPCQYKELRHFIQKTLVFDIDLDDYTDKKCQCQHKCCALCWQFGVTAFKKIQDIFQINFNVDKLFPFFSGRRGLHIYCLDEKLSYIDMMQRQNLYSYLNSIPEIKIDYGVLCQKNHTLKLPFIYHPTTKLLAQYIDDINTFIPENAYHIDDGIEFYLDNIKDFQLTRNYK